MRLKHPRRPVGEWQHLIRQQAESELSAKAFCERNDIAYQSFINWKRRLSAELPSTRIQHNSLPQFVELTTPQHRVDAHPRWLVELDLGGGVQLRIAHSN